jgi:tRNA-specific 2-thiouridylase
MSGGVDSSVAAALLRKDGHEVVAISMRLYDVAPKSDRSCCSPDDMFDARRVAAKLEIPFYVANYVDAFQERVIDYFVEEYRRGRTPNPCVACNNHLKFEVLLGRTRELGGAWLATGHYARIEKDGDRWRLLKARDLSKDQSYFLCGLPREMLGRIRFPLGDLTKTEVRALAEEAGLPTAHKPESQEICFVTGTSYRDFVKERLESHDVIPGNIVLEDGQVLGTHDGIHGFTIGQRRGLGIAWHEPLFVKRVVPETGDVVVGLKSELLAGGLVASACNWLRWDTPPGPFDAEVKIRYRAQPVPCAVRPQTDGSVLVMFDEAQRSVTPGQYAVFYDGEEVLGGACIDMALPAEPDAEASNL